MTTLNSRNTPGFTTTFFIAFILFLFEPACCLLSAQHASADAGDVTRERLLINQGWRFLKYDSVSLADILVYDQRPDVVDLKDDKVADSRPTEGAKTEEIQDVLKAWILPSGNKFIKDPSMRHTRPAGNPGGDFPFVQSNLVIVRFTGEKSGSLKLRATSSGIRGATVMIEGRTP